MRLARLIDDLINWAKQREDIVAIAIVGSHASGRARPDSDFDVMLLCDSPQTLLQDQDWRARFGAVVRTKTETWGVLGTLRTFYQDGAEVEFNLVSPSWAAIPIEAGTREVISGGIKILHDPRGILTKAVAIADKAD